MSKTLYGRVLLWQLDINECRELLRLGERAYDSAKRQVRDLPKLKEHQPEWAAMSDDQYHKASAEIENTCPDAMEFPTRNERLAVYAYLEVLAIVALMRVWNRGDPMEGVAAANVSKGPVANLRERMIKLAFPDPEERSKFDALLEVLKAVRNQTIAHTDAETRDIKYFEQLVAYGASSTNALNLVDVDELIPCVERLHDSVRVVLEEAGRQPD